MEQEIEIGKWGNSLAFRIPRYWAQALSLKAGNKIKIYADGERLIMEKATKLCLDDLVAKITPENIHAEIDYGIDAGKEGWDE